MAQPHASPSPADFKAQLARLLSLPVIARSRNSRRLLECLGRAHLEGRSPAPSQYDLAYEVLGMGKDFNPDANPVVRMQVARLRRALAAHYADHGLVDPIHISIPPGSYHLRVERAVRIARKPAARISPALALVEFRGLGLRDIWAHLPAVIAEELSIVLGRLPGLRVLGPFSRARLEADGVEPAELGRRHAADFILDGSLEADGDRQVLRVRLLDGATGAQVWSARYACGPADCGLAEIEAQVGARIADELGVDFGPAQSHLSALALVKPAAVLEVREAVVTARAYMAAFTPELHDRAVLSLRRAVRDHPDEALPHAMLSLVLAAATTEPGVPFGTTLAELAALANQAYVLDPASAWSVAALAAACAFQGRDSELAALAGRVEADTAVPHFHRAMVGFWMVQRKVRAADGLRMIRAAVASNPHLPPVLHIARALLALEAGDTKGVRAALRDYNWPGGWFDHLLSAAAAALDGDAAEARRRLGQVEGVDPGFTRRGPRLALVSHPDHVAALASALRRAGLTLPRPAAPGAGSAGRARASRRRS